MKIRPLPLEAQGVCDTLNAPPQLVAHLTLVHDVACTIVEQVQKQFPLLAFDADAVCFGASTHDIGKALVPEELTGPGNRHEEFGPPLLEKLGISPGLARFARTHGSWEEDSRLGLEDLLVALADNIWRGKREPVLEERIAKLLPGETWETMIIVDEFVSPIADKAEERLAWQQCAINME